LTGEIGHPHRDFGRFEKPKPLTIEDTKGHRGKAVSE
jgi:hypothetical protein